MLYKDDGNRQHAKEPNHSHTMSRREEEKFCARKEIGARQLGGKINRRGCN